MRAEATGVCRRLQKGVEQVAANGRQIAAELIRDTASGLYRLALGEADWRQSLSRLAVQTLVALDYAPGTDSWTIGAWAEVRQAALRLKVEPDPDRAVALIQALCEAYLSAGLSAGLPEGDALEEEKEKEEER